MKKLAFGLLILGALQGGILVGMEVNDDEVSLEDLNSTTPPVYGAGVEFEINAEEEAPAKIFQIDPERLAEKYKQFRASNLTNISEEEFQAIIKQYRPIIGPGIYNKLSDTCKARYIYDHAQNAAWVRESSSPYLPQQSSNKNHDKSMKLLIANINRGKDSNDPFLVLGIGRSANDQQVSKAHKELCAIFHPDKNTGNAEFYDEICQKINWAKDQIEDQKTRIIFAKLAGLNFNPDKKPTVAKRVKKAIQENSLSTVRDLAQRDIQNLILSFVVTYGVRFLRAFTMGQTYPFREFLDWLEPNKHIIIKEEQKEAQVDQETALYKMQLTQMRTETNKLRALKEEVKYRKGLEEFKQKKQKEKAKQQQAISTNESPVGTSTTAVITSESPR